MGSGLGLRIYLRLPRKETDSYITEQRPWMSTRYELWMDVYVWFNERIMLVFNGSESAG